MRIGPTLVAVVLVSVMLAGCDRVAASPVGSAASSGRTPSAARSARPPSSTETPTLAPGVVAAAFPACTLPYVKPGDLNAAQIRGGFVGGAGAAWAPDPAGLMSEAGVLLVTKASPSLTGSSISSTSGVSFDSVVRRWLPVTAAQTRPDGLAYAHAEPVQNASYVTTNTTQVHVVSLPDGADRVIYSGDVPFVVIGYGAEGIYLTYGLPDNFTGLWRMNPTTGAVTKLSSTGEFFLVAGGGAWMDNGTASSTPYLDRIDLATGRIERWVDGAVRLVDWTRRAIPS